jgi:hypothetical protein
VVTDFVATIKNLPVRRRRPYFGFVEAEALGRSLNIIIRERLRRRHWEGFYATMRAGRSRYGEGHVLSVPAIRKDRAQISIEFTIVPFTGETGEMIGITAIMRDALARLQGAMQPPPTARRPRAQAVTRYREAISRSQPPLAIVLHCARAHFCCDPARGENQNSYGLYVSKAPPVAGPHRAEMFHAP